jgi:hypothetical protein
MWRRQLQGRSSVLGGDYVGVRHLALPSAASLQHAKQSNRVQVSIRKRVNRNICRCGYVYVHLLNHLIQVSVLSPPGYEVAKANN